MPDPVFADARLAAIYDAFDGQRSDLDHYLSIAKALSAKSVLDVGCGTGSFACLLSEEGFDTIGVDPAQASLDIARTKPFADPVRWMQGDTSALPPLAVDMAVMAGNVAQVFLSAKSWEENLGAIHKALKPGGHLVFEVRDPAQRAWLRWTRENTYKRMDIPNIGQVEGWCNVTDVSGDLVSFRWTYLFEADGAMLTSDSTLRFRKKDEIIESLEKSGYGVKDIRDAPDRPSQELVFIAQTL